MKTLKQKIEEAAERRSVDADACCECEAEESFKAGAQFLLDEGYGFSREDLKAAFEAGEDFVISGLDMEVRPNFEEWLKERKKK